MSVCYTNACVMISTLLVIMVMISSPSIVSELILLMKISCTNCSDSHISLQSLPFSVQEFLDFTSKIIVERTNIAQRASVKEQGMCTCVLHVHAYSIMSSVTYISKI